MLHLFNVFVDIRSDNKKHRTQKKADPEKLPLSVRVSELLEREIWIPSITIYLYTYLFIYLFSHSQNLIQREQKLLIEL